MIWAVFRGFVAGFIHGYLWGLPNIPGKQLMPHLQLALFLSLMKLNEANLELESAEMELKKINMKLKKSKRELKRAKMELLEAIRTQMELVVLMREIRQDHIMWEYETDFSLKMAEDECIEILRSRINSD